MVSMTHKARVSPGLLLFILALATTASAEWKEKVLYSFQGGTDGSIPAGGVIFDKAGNLYGLTIYGGSTACPPGWCGTFYQLSPPPQKGGNWTETVLYVFKGHNQNDGSSPSGGLIADDAGNFYGVTGYGGSGPCVLFGTATGCGTVFELSPPAQKGGAWTETVLYNFQGGNDGDLPTGPLVFDKVGNLYGATEFGGGKGATCDVFYGGNCGTAFELSPPKTKGGKWTENVLHSFAGIASGKQYGDGAVPNGGLLLDSKGAIYGTTYIGGDNCPHNSGQGCGTVFEVRPTSGKGGAWTENILHRFEISEDEANPAAGMTFDGKGYLYGTTAGTVFRLAPPPMKSGHWKETILHTFNQDEYDPKGTLIFDASDNLYGTAEYGSNGTRYGSVFKLRARNISEGPWNLGVLYGFAGSPDGAYPAAALIFNKHGSLFSTTQGGGTGTSCSGYCGTVFEVWP
jgi:hypothetical protein